MKSLFYAFVKETRSASNCAIIRIASGCRNVRIKRILRKERKKTRRIINSSKEIINLKKKEFVFVKKNNKFGI